MTKPDDQRPAAPGSDDLLGLLIESSTDFAIFALDPQGTVISWNVGAQRALGYSSDDILARDGDVIFTPEDRAAGAPERERAVALRDGVAEDERWHQRKDGTRFWGSGSMMPLRDGVDGFVKILRDRTEHHLADERLRESEERFRLLATHIPQLVFRSISTGERTWGSPQWADFTGLSDLLSREYGWLDAVHPDDREFTVEAWTTAQETGHYDVEHRILRIKDGEYRWHQTRARPIGDERSSEVEWVGTSTDIHDLRGLQGRQSVLLAELQHRSRNLLGVIQATARQTLRTTTSLDAFGVEFESRLRALSRVQSLLARSEHETIALRTIVEAELRAHAGDALDSVRIEGPAVNVPATSAQALALAVHELATNALKYGALRQPDARLSVTWRTEDDEGALKVVLEWRESGVNMPDGPRRKGYGSELIERALPYQLKAHTRMDFGPDGVVCTIETPAIAAEEPPHA